MEVLRVYRYTDPILSSEKDAVRVIHLPKG